MLAAEGEKISVHSIFQSLLSAILSCCHGDVVTLYASRRCAQPQGWGFF